jgi:hypothetical protein
MTRVRFLPGGRLVFFSAAYIPAGAHSASYSKSTGGLFPHNIKGEGIKLTSIQSRN